MWAGATLLPHYLCAWPWLWVGRPLVLFLTQGFGGFAVAFAGNKHTIHLFCKQINGHDCGQIMAKPWSKSLEVLSANRATSWRCALICVKVTECARSIKLPSLYFYLYFRCTSFNYNGQQSSPSQRTPARRETEQLCNRKELDESEFQGTF